MLLLSGPPGSGKTHQVLDKLWTAAGRGAVDTQLLVPTATMAEHLRHALTREGLLVRPSSIVTLFHFVEEHAKGFDLASGPVLRRLVRRALRDTPPGEFGGVADFPGFLEALVHLIEELSASGLPAHRLEKLSSSESWPSRPARPISW